MSRKALSVLAAVSLALSMGMIAYAGEASSEGAETPAIVSCAGYDQDGNNLTFHLTGNDGTAMDLKVEPIDEAGVHANITLGDDEPFVGSFVDLSAFPAYAEAAGITFEAGTEAE